MTALDRAGGLRYAQCWEDAEVARAALQIKPGATVLAIAAAGDNVLALLQDDPARVLAVDVSPAQTALVHLKMAALAGLADAGEVRGFLGAQPARDRLRMYERVASRLPPAARRQWDSDVHALESGVLSAGRFERYLALFRRAILPIVPGRGTIRAMLAATALEEQRRIYRDRWDSAPWRLMFRAFFSRRFLQAFGRDPAFFDQCEVDDVASHYLGRARHALTNLSITTNPYLTWMLSGRFGRGRRAPDYLERDAQAVIRGRLHRVAVHTASLDAVLANLPSRSVDAFYLSDVFELSTADAYATTLAEIARVGRPGARICYWNNLVTRRRPPVLAAEIETHEAEATALHAGDRAFLYSRLVVESVRGAAA